LAKFGELNAFTSLLKGQNSDIVALDDGIEHLGWSRRFTYRKLKFSGKFEWL